MATKNSTPDSVDSGVSGSLMKQDSVGGDLSKKLMIGSKFAGVWRVASPLNHLSISNNKVGSSSEIPIQEQQQQIALISSYNQQRQQQQRRQSQLASQFNLPIASRQVRDSGSLLFMLIFLGFLGYIIWDGIFIKQTDINLIVHGHDSYGNICGRDNKPIKFVEKSGKNYSTKPFTKYTLINAQFERYTLDSDKLKNGQLFYIKQNYYEPSHNTVVNDNTHQHSSSPSDNDKNHEELEYARSSTSKVGPVGEVNGKIILANTSATYDTNITVKRTKRNASSDVPLQVLTSSLSSSSSSSQPQTPSSPLLLTSELLAASQRNQTLLRQLKSTLMYQYPHFYGYNNHDESIRPSAKVDSTIGGGTIRSSGSHLVSPSPSSSSSSMWTLTSRQKQDQVKETSTRVTGIDEQLNLSAQSSRGNHRQQQFSPSNNNIDVYGASSINPLGTSASIASTTTTTARAITHLLQNPNVDSSNYDDLRHAVYFDDHINETEHMFISPSNTNNMKPRKTQDGFYENDLNDGGTNQLLYLTECVDYCPPTDHVELIFYRCMPKNWRFSLFPNAINVTRTFIDDMFTDMTHCYKELIYIFSLALVLSLGLLILLRFLASLIIWSCLLLLVALILSMASYAWLNYYYLILDLNNSLPNNSVYSEKLSSSDKWLIGAIFLTFVTFVAIATILFMRKRILMVTMLFRESGKAIADMPLLLLQPVLTFAALVSITLIWSIGLICLQSIKTPTIDMSTGFVVFKSELLYKIMKWYHIFAFLWISHFAIACQHYVIGASVSKWYFSTDRYNLHSPIGSSVSELILYYMGSVALGSFLVAIFKVIKIIVRQIQYLIQRNCLQPTHIGGTQNGASLTGGGSALEVSAGSAGSSSLFGPQMQASTSWCGSCSYLWRLFIWFFDNIVMIINRDAYVEVAIHGHSFLSGAQRALTVLASNPLRLLAIKSVGNILLVVAKICVVFGTVSMAIVLLDDKTHQLNYSWSPLVVSALFAYVVAHWFLSVYEMVIDALFICYCEDYERSKTIEIVTSNGHVNGSNFMAQILNNGQVY